MKNRLAEAIKRVFVLLFVGVMGFGCMVLMVIGDSYQPPKPVEAVDQNFGTDSVWNWRTVPAGVQIQPSLSWQRIPITNDKYKALKISLRGRESIVWAEVARYNFAGAPAPLQPVSGDISIIRNSFPVAKWTVSLADRDPKFRSFWYPKDVVVKNPAALRERDEIEASGNVIKIETPSGGKTKIRLLPGEVLEIGEEGIWHVFLQRTDVYYDSGSWEIAVPQ